MEILPARRRGSSRRGASGLAGGRTLLRLTLFDASSSSSGSATGPRAVRTTLGSIRLTAGSPFGFATTTGSSVTRGAAAGSGIGG